MRKFGIKTGAPAKLALFLAIAGMVLPGWEVLRAETAPRPMAVTAPPMGWSSWNSFSNTVDSQIIQDQAKAMVSTGMSKLGYKYVNIDEGWWLGQREADGKFVVDGKAWPALAAGERAGDMANIVRYIHGLGLKAGIYTDAGEDGCSMFPDLGPVYLHTGSEGHYEQDFLQFAQWGFDYVKVDWCGGDKEKRDPAIQYAEVARAISRAEAMTGHRLYFSICNWGNNSPWTWAPNVGGVAADIWRTGGDIVAPIVANNLHSDRKATLKDLFREFDAAVHPEAQHTGFYNDPDMMVVGMPGLTDAQNRLHMSLWAVLGGPLLVGADLAKLSDAAQATLTNPEVVAVDQDSLGLQGVKVAEAGAGLEVWSKALAKAGERAVVLLNRTDQAASIAVRWGDLGLVETSPVTVRDLWAGKDLGGFNSTYSATVPPGDAVMLLIHGREGRLTTYKPAAAAAGGATQKKSLPISFNHVASHGRYARVQITYSNPDKGPRFAELWVNGQTATRVGFPSTGAENSMGTIWIQSLFDRAGANNVLTFSPVCEPGPGIESIAVE